MTDTFRNPVLAGSYPDPSICRVGADYYLVTSTFEYFPGLPVHHSRDLVNWRQIGHVLDRPEQLDLDGVRPSDGLYAPTIRYAEGVFYVVCTLVRGHGRSGNFVVTADDPTGPWCDPVWLNDAEGFDPSLFFDDDGHAWFCAAAEQDDAGHTSVWVQEFDREKLALVGERHEIWRGAQRGARWAEAPHIYRIDGTVYLLAAEGGTSLEHAVVVARGEQVTGPYENCVRNPVLTARHLGNGADIVATGHADLVQTPDGDWWAVLLGVRDGEVGNLGRETFLTPVGWEAGWPVFNPGVGRVLLDERRPDLPATPRPTEPTKPRCDSFDDELLAPSWMFVRTPRDTWWSPTERPGHLRLRLRPETLTDQANPSFVCRRQQHRDFTAFTAVDFVPRTESECAGIAVMHSDAFQLRCEIAGVGQRMIRVVRRVAGVDDVVAQLPVVGDAVRPGEPVRPGAAIRLGVEVRGSRYEFRVAAPAGGWRAIAQVDGSALSYRSAGGFFGVVVGLYASSNGTASTNVADFDWFEYDGISD